MSESLQDVFISHASDDKPSYVNPLTESLSARQVTFWLDSAEIGWGDSVFGKINEGLRTSQFALLCLSGNFLLKPWPEAEMAAVLAIQNTAGVKRALPLILNSKEEVLKHYPLIAGLAYREFDHGPDKLSAEIASMIKRHEKSADEIHLTVEGVHSGKLCRLTVSRNASVEWLAKKGQGGLGVAEALRAGPCSEFRVRWVLVDVEVEDVWLNMSRREKRKIHALIASESGARLAYSGRDRIEELGVKDGTVFHLYAIEDVLFEPPTAYRIVSS